MIRRFKLRIAALLMFTFFITFLTGCEPPQNRVLKRAAGEDHACALDNAISGVQCWGDNSDGESTVPVLSGPRDIAVGGDFSCALDDSGVVCWGKQDRIPTEKLEHANSIVAGFDHACALVEGSVECWGSNEYGQVSGAESIQNAVSIVAGGFHNCVILANGNFECWGRNDEGQLSHPAITSLTDLSLGGYHSCGLSGGMPICWGQSIISDQVPQVAAVSIHAGANHACINTQDDTALCWGDQSSVGFIQARDLTFINDIAVGGSRNVNSASAFGCARHLQGVACWGHNSEGQAVFDGGANHTMYRSESLIDAPADFVWSVLVDLERYPLWNPFTIEMESTLLVNDPMNMKTFMADLGPNGTALDVVENIRVIDNENYKACWGINTNTPQLLTGERCQWLEVMSDTQTRYITEDLIEGQLTPFNTLLTGSSVSKGFDGVAAELKRYVELHYEK